MMKSSGQKKALWHALWPFFALAAMIGVFFGDVLFGGKTICMRDTFCQFLPTRQFAVAAWHKGLFPLWNPMNSCGAPFLADPMSALLYPFYFPFYFLSPAGGLCAVWIMHTAIAAFAMYGLGRQWRLDRVPSLLMAVAFVFSTWPASRMEFLTEFTTIVWGPVLLLLATRLIDRFCSCPGGIGTRLWQNLHFIAALTLVFTIQYFASHPEMFLYSFLLVAGYSIGLCWFRADFRAMAAMVLSLGISGVLTGCMVAPQFLLTTEFLPMSERGISWNPLLSMASFHPLQWLTFVFPFLFGRPGWPDQYWGRTLFEFWAGTCYVGLLPWMMIPFALCKPGESSPQTAFIRRLILYFGGIGLLGMILAAGQYTPVYQWLYEHVPVFNRFRWPSKLLVFVFYSTVVLGAIGYQAFTNLASTAPGRARKRLTAVSIAFGFLLLTVWMFSWQGSPFFELLAGHPLRQQSSAIAFAQNDVLVALFFGAATLGALWIRVLRPAQGRLSDGLVVLVLFFNLFFITREVQPRLDRALYALELPAELKPLASPQWRVHSMYSEAQQWIYGRRDGDAFRWGFQVGLGDSWLPAGIYKTWNGGMKLMRDNLFVSKIYSLGPQAGGRLADCMSIRYVVAGPPAQQILFAPGGMETGRLQLIERPSALPRAYCVPAWDFVPDGDRLLQELANGSWDLKTKALVEAEFSDALASLPTAGNAAGSVSHFRDDWNSVHLEAEVPTRQLLVLNDRWYPGWKALVDGGERPILKVNYLARGVLLEPGKHRVDFHFEPAGMRAGICLCTAGAVVILGMFTIAFLQMRRERTCRPGDE